MSYCRFSSDDYQCDVYVYRDVAGGWTTHVAGRRPVFAEPLPPPIPITDDASVSRWLERREKVEEMLNRAKPVTIGGPCDGQTFNVDSASECAALLERLRTEGYNVPQYALDALRAEENASEGRRQ